MVESAKGSSHFIVRLGYGLSALLLLGSIGIWFATGAHSGWTQTKLPVEHTDDITGLTYTEYQEGFIAGVEFPAIGLSLAIATALITFFVNRKHR